MMVPRIAIIDQNTLEATGLKSIIDNIIPMVDVSIFSSLEDMQAESETPFFHFFVSSQILLSNTEFFLQHPHQTIVLTSQPMASTQFARFHTLNTAQKAEVLALVVRGFINKEIADQLCISLPTVISHRKNICEKLHMHSVSALTIYAVTHGIVSIDEI